MNRKRSNDTKGYGQMIQACVFFLLLAFALTSKAYSGDFYYSGGERIPVTVSKDRVAVELTKVVSYKRGNKKFGY